ncbi:PIR protein [Plasmodium vivax]|nr:PIR protein [Plasmodium vivax]
MGGITINVYDRNQALNSQDCIRTYVDVLDDIQGRIAEFEENEHVNFHKDWEQLIKYINEQKNELKICYDRKLLEIHLNSNEDIIRFYRKCNSNPKCRNYILPQDKELIELKDGTEASCEKDRDCGNQVKATKEKASEGTSQLNEKDSRIQTLESQKSQGPNENSIDGKESRQDQAISQDQHDVKSRETSVGPDSEGSEPKVVHSNPHIPIDNQIQRIGIPSQQTHSVLGSNPDNPSPQSRSEGESPPTGIPQGKTSETIDPKSDAPNSQPLNGNANGAQNVGSQTDEEHTSVNKDGAVASTTANRAAGTSISGNPADRSPPPIVTDRAVDGGISLPSVGTAGIGVTTELSGHAISSVESTTGSALPGEVDTTKAAGNSPTDSKAADAVLDVGANQGKAACSENLRNNDSGQEFTGGTSCTEALPSNQEILGNKVSSASVSDSAELQMDNSIKSEPYTGQEATGLERQSQKEKTQKGGESHQEVHSDTENHSHRQSSQNQEGHQGSTGGVLHVNHEKSERINLQENPSVAGTAEEAASPWNGNILYMFNRLFSEGQYKEYIMMALVPLAIILLLTFLIKFTPMGTLFTKKKKKKQQKMNEKLQRVLSEYPAQMNERSIPFSYSPFAYST